MKFKKYHLILVIFTRHIQKKLLQSGAGNPEDVDFKETNRDLEDSYEASYNEFNESAHEIRKIILFAKNNAE